MVSRYVLILTVLAVNFSSYLAKRADKQRFTTSPLNLAMSNTSSAEQPLKVPSYFLGIGGPNFAENTEHPAYAQLAAIGHEITTQVQPKAVVVFSAHWQAGANCIEINAAEDTDLIYDFYGFPPHFYEYEYPYKGSPAVAEQVIDKLTAINMEVKRVKRGLDHGVWAGFIVELTRVAFDPKKNPLNVPIVQVSLYGSTEPDQHYRIGQALASLRDEGILIVGAGMAVHNLHDFRAMRGSAVRTMPYAVGFDDALKEAATARPEERREKMSALLHRDDARKAHPTLEHLLPMYVAAGAAGLDVGERIWTMPEGSLSWAQYRFGEVRKA